MKEIIEVPSSSLKVGHPDTEEERKAMFQLRAEVYRKEGYITAQHDIDEYDLNNKCVYFIANIDDKLVGTVRIIIDDRLPTELYFDFKEPEEIAIIPRNKRCEIGRLIVIAKGMNHLVSLILVKAMFLFGKDNGLLGGYASMFRGFFQILCSIGMPLHQINPATPKFNGKLLHSYFYESVQEVVPLYFIRDDAIEFMERMKL